MTHPSWVALLGMAHSFIELDKAVVHEIRLVKFSVIVVFNLSALWWIRIRDLWKLPDGRDCLWGKLGLVLMGRAMLSKSLIHSSVEKNPILQFSKLVHKSLKDHVKMQFLKYPVINNNGKESEKECRYTYNNHFVVQQKLTQHCKSAVFHKIFLMQFLTEEVWGVAPDLTFPMSSQWGLPPSLWQYE